jgi:hypothetical protein
MTRRDFINRCSSFFRMIASPQQEASFFITLPVSKRTEKYFSRRLGGESPGRWMNKHGCIFLSATLHSSSTIRSAPRCCKVIPLASSSAFVATSRRAWNTAARHRSARSASLPWSVAYVGAYVPFSEHSQPCRSQAYASRTAFVITKGLLWSRQECTISVAAPRLVKWCPQT